MLRKAATASRIITMDAQYINSFQQVPITDNYIVLLANTDNITDNFTFLCFRQQFITFVCTPDGKKGKDVVRKDG